MRFSVLVSLLLPLAAAWAGPSPARWEMADLFQAGRGGYAYYRIPGLVVTPRGTVLAYCEARREGRDDWEDIDVLLRRSPDGGRTWEAPRRIAQVPGPHEKNPVALARGFAPADQVTYSNPVAIAARDGTVHFLFCLEFNRCFYLRSADDGVSFSAPVEITATFAAFRPKAFAAVIAAGPAHGIELSNGRLVVPVTLSNGEGANGFRPSIVATIVSDDQGRNWRAGEIALGIDPQWANPSCGIAVQLADGRVMINARSESRPNRRVVVVGRDGAGGWAPAFDPALLEPVCMGSLVRLSRMPRDDRNRLLFSNPDNLGRRDGTVGPGVPRDRVNLSIKLSYDEGRTWPVSKTLDPGVSAYSDLGVLPDGTILCLYERGAASVNSHQMAFLSLARFNLEWLTGGADWLRPGPGR